MIDPEILNISVKVPDWAADPGTACDAELTVRVHLTGATSQAANFVRETVHAAVRQSIVCARAALTLAEGSATLDETRHVAGTYIIDTEPF